jgi:hypothetical protein
LGLENLPVHEDLEQNRFVKPPGPESRTTEILRRNGNSIALKASPSAVVILVSVWAYSLSLVGHRSDEEGLTQDGRLGDSALPNDEGRKRQKIARDVEFKFNLTKKK